MGMADVEDTPLENPRHEAFCQFATTYSYAEAYRQAFGRDHNDFASRNVFDNTVYQLSGRIDITVRIGQIQAKALKPLGVSRDWLLAWWYQRMTYNPEEIMAWAVHACHYCHGDGHGYQWREPDYMEALAAAEQAQAPLPDIGGGFGYTTRASPHADCPKCDGRGISRSDIADTRELSSAARAGFDGIKETRQGIEIKMADKDKAAEQFAKLSGFDVAQVRLLTGDIPDDTRLAELARDPLAIAAAYREMIGAGTKH